ncbi:MAG: C39 family peptidase [Patescibacteria group bacterium]
MHRYFVIFALFIAFFAVNPTAACAASGAFEHVRGRILIDVEQNGEAWYVHPGSGKRYYLNSAENALSVMRELSLGISNQNLALVPTENDIFTLKSELNHLRGRILLQVENDGMAWYVHPDSGRRYRLGSPTDAWQVMTSLALGITHINLAAIPPAIFLSRSTYQSAPFTTQAPYAEWSDPRQQDGCEEASALMAVYWSRGQSLDRPVARGHIVAAAHYEEQHLGFFEDTSIDDTAEHILRGYFNFSDFSVRHDISVGDIAHELLAGHIVLIGAEGRSLGNPNFPGQSPFRHMLVVLGYDAETDQFITHDPGTRNGENYRYSPEVLQRSLLDYPSGYREPVDATKTALIAVRRP